MPTVFTPSTYGAIVDGYSVNGSTITPIRIVQSLSNGFSVRKDITYDPNWRVKVAKKQSASNPYRVSYAEAKSHRPATYVAQAVGFFETAKHESTKNASFSVGGFPSDSALVDIALGRLRSRISSANKDFKSLVPTAELREMRSMISSLANLTSDTLKTLIDVKRTKGRSALRYASQAWLNFSFAASPLMAEVKSASEAVVAFLEREDHSVRLYGHSYKLSHSHLRSGGGFATSVASLDQVQSCVSELSYMMIAGVNFEMKSANNYDALQHFHIEPYALSSVAWELTPFSWVADYFGTVGEYLDDTFVGTSAGTTYIVLCCKFTQNVSTEYTWRSTNNSKPIISSTPGNTQALYSTFERTPYLSLPTRSIRLRSRDEVGRSSINRVLNLASILTTTAGESKDKLDRFKRTRFQQLRKLRHL